MLKWRCQYNEDGTPNQNYKEFNKNKKDRFKVYGKELAYELAPEPSDIIWENLQFGRSYKLAMEFKVFLGIVSFLLLTFGLIMSLRL